MVRNPTEGKCLHATPCEPCQIALLTAERDRLKAALETAKAYIEDGTCGTISRESALKIIWEAMP